MDGRAVAAWLTDRIDPSRVYDHRDLHYLGEVGIVYDEVAHMLMAEGAIAQVRTYTPADLIKHPVITVRGVQSDYPQRVVIGSEIAAAVHQLVWPAEAPPGTPTMDLRMSYHRNVRSIAERNGLAYRDDPPGGWWVEQPTRRKI